MGKQADRKAPRALWIALAALAAKIVLKALVSLLLHPLELALAGVYSVLLVGLLLGIRWAYVLTVALLALGIGREILGNADGTLTTLLLNPVILVSLFLSAPYYFRKHNETPKAARVEPRTN